MTEVAYINFASAGTQQIVAAKTGACPWIARIIMSSVPGASLVVSCGPTNPATHLIIRCPAMGTVDVGSLLIATDAGRLFTAWASATCDLRLYYGWSEPSPRAP